MSDASKATYTKTFVIDIKANSVDLTDVLNIKLYPNPAQDKVVIEGENISLILIYNAVGSLVKEIQTESGNSPVTIQLVDIESGLYFINIKNNKEQNTVRKLIKQ